ncbi:MAG: tRNA guanosine(34) transglycosylase Tgt [Bacteroidetes bacterium]|nr:tRNA guanosine(34) transglycosylase Tgt [Bacteroidota bacterium]
MKKLTFDLLKTDDGGSKARAGVIHTERGDIETPIFMPVGTRATVRGVPERDLHNAGAQIILGNTYHLYLRPGNEVLISQGGLHKFASWPKPILTDSGGYQVFSLAKLRKLTADGVTFRSHIDGSSHFFTPESVIEAQRAIGSDIMMVLDECPPHPCEHIYAKNSNEITMKWAKRCQVAVENSEPLYGKHQALFPIVQGSVYKDLREYSAKTLVDMDFEGYAIGGLSVGEPIPLLYEFTDFTTDFLPKDKPRYLMGVGTPANLLEGIARGIDMFDCVMPTRNGRNATIFTRMGGMNIKNMRYINDPRPIDEACTCYACTTYSRSYIRHLFTVQEMLAPMLASIHNIHFYLEIMKEARKHILDGTWSAWYPGMAATVGGKMVDGQ